MIIMVVCMHVYAQYMQVLFKITTALYICTGRNDFCLVCKCDSMQTAVKSVSHQQTCTFSTTAEYQGNGVATFTLYEPSRILFLSLMYTLSHHAHCHGEHSMPAYISYEEMQIKDALKM